MLAALDTSDSIALGAGIIALLAFGVAVWSVLVSRGANKLSEDANDLAGRALRHTERQTELAEAAEQERARRAIARAVMEAEMSPLIYTSEGNTGNFRPLVRVRNVGDRDSGRTTVRVYMVAGQDMMAWDDEQTRHDRTRPLTDPGVTFHHPVTQAPLPAQYIERTIENVTTTMPIEMRVVIPMAIPGPGKGRNRLPVRVVVRAEHAAGSSEWTDYLQTEYGRSHG